MYAKHSFNYNYLAFWCIIQFLVGIKHSKTPLKISLLLIEYIFTKSNFVSHIKWKMFRKYIFPLFLFRISYNIHFCLDEISFLFAHLKIFNATKIFSEMWNHECKWNIFLFCFKIHLSITNIRNLWFFIYVAQHKRFSIWISIYNFQSN